MKIDPDVAIGVGAVVLMVVLATLLFMAGMAKADTCMTMTVHPEQVIGNYDGDTFTVSLGALGVMHVRVQDVDTPERTKKQPGWDEAKAFTEKWLHAGPFDLWTCFTFTFGRVVGVPYRGDETLAQALINEGYAKE